MELKAQARVQGQWGDEVARISQQLELEGFSA
jgi:hypothetical protein